MEKTILLLSTMVFLFDRDNRYSRKIIPYRYVASANLRLKFGTAASSM